MTDDHSTNFTTSIAPLAVRERFMAEPLLGAGNFLDYALEHNPNRSVPFAFSHGLDHRDRVVIHGHSLVDLAAQRDRYARWYWANGVRPGDPVGVVVAEGVEPLIHFLALSALGAIATLINDAMRPDVLIRYLDQVGVAALPTTPPSSPRPIGRTRSVGPGSSPWLARYRRSTQHMRCFRISTRTGIRPTTWSR
ncbi:MAG: AMP-binding protein [Nocardioidaceae bacterium]